MKRLNKRLDLDEFFDSLKESDTGVLALDFDGTLAPFEVSRNTVRPYPGVAQVLDRILEGGRSRVVIISGRAVSDLVPLLGLKHRPEVWGCHGRERLTRSGKYNKERMSILTTRGLEKAEASLDELGYLSRSERKHGCLALHTRGLVPEAARKIEQEAAGKWKSIANTHGLTLTHFDGGIELRSPVCNKGGAIKQVLSEVDRRAPVAYLGDDTTDEDAFEALKKRGLSVLVREQLRNTAADFWVVPPDELVLFLERWLESVSVPATRA